MSVEWLSFSHKLTYTGHTTSDSFLSLIPATEKKRFHIHSTWTGFGKDLSSNLLDAKWSIAPGNFQTWSPFARKRALVVWIRPIFANWTSNVPVPVSFVFNMNLHKQTKFMASMSFYAARLRPVETHLWFISRYWPYLPTWNRLGPTCTDQYTSIFLLFISCVIPKYTDNSWKSQRTRLLMCTSRNRGYPFYKASLRNTIAAIIQPDARPSFHDRSWGFEFRNGELNFGCGQPKMCLGWDEVSHLTYLMNVWHFSNCH